MLTSTDTNFQGRQTKRSDGKEKRIRLLDATLRIIVRDGMRGVRHRAVAAEADVSLSSTTYYFKDIHDLITDAFIHFANQELEDSLQLKEISMEALTNIQSVDELLLKETLPPVISIFIHEHISSQLKDVDRRRLEYAFQNEALHNEKLASVLVENRAAMLEMIEQFFSYLGSKHPRANAHITLACIRHIEYQLVLDNNLSVDDPLIENIIKDLIDGQFSAI